MANSLFKSSKKVVTTPPTSKKAPKPEPEPEKTEKPTAPSGLKMVSVRFTKSQWRQIKDFALDEDTSIQALIVEALAEKMNRKGITLKTS